MATFVAVEDGTFAGVADGFLAEGGTTVEIGGMWVHPHRRRAGIARGLLAAICDWARERGAVAAGLWVRETNVPARLLYEHDGFERVNTSGSDTASGLRLEKTL